MFCLVVLRFFVYLQTERLKLFFMTLLVSWAGLDQKKTGKKVASIYFAADSRYTWKNPRSFKDDCQKVFRSQNYPEIFALCGDVNLASSFIDSALKEIDNGTRFANMLSYEQKIEILTGIAESVYDNYPRNKLLDTKTVILYGTRISYYEFHMGVFTCSPKDRIRFENCCIDEGADAYSDLMTCDGEGESEFRDLWTRYSNDKAISAGTSRAIYQCLTDTLKVTNVETVGHIPQIVGLYRKGAARYFGTCTNGNLYVAGKQVLEITDDLNDIEWRNENFERVDPYTKELLAGAQRQPKEATP